jgi:transmembrane sensor
MTRIDFNKDAFEKANLIIRHFEGKLTEQEERELEKWLSEDAANLPFLKSLENKTQLDKELKFFSSVKVYTDLEKVKQRIATSEAKPERNYSSYIKYAAILLITLSVGLGFYLRNRSVETQQAELAASGSQTKINDILPGKDNAKLELADGSVVILPISRKGSSGKIKGTSIDIKNGVIVYNSKSIVSTTTAYNKVSTPKGGKYRVVLADGTTVWLNSESSLRFPTTFNAKQRLVELTGEAYFDVAKNKKKPFRVKVADVTVEALGTHFNIMGYTNEGAIKTTLVEGSIKVSKGTVSKMVVPGQQIEIKNKMTLIDEVNVYEAIAWKDDLFEFSDTDLSSITRQMERWYDVKIECSPELGQRHLTGTISRNTNISQVLEMLKQTGINYKLEERRITLFK